MKRGPWTHDELEEVRRRYPDEPAADIARDLDRTLPMVYHWARKLGLSKSRAFLKRMADHARPWEDWTEEDLDTLRRRYPHEKTERIAKDLRRTVSGCYGMATKLGLSKTPEFMQSPDAGGIRPGERRGRKYEFQKGHVPANKGLRRPGFAPGRMHETQFKKGQQRADTLPLGGLRLESKQRVWLVKVKLDGPIQHRYQPLARIVWERERGPIPPKHVVRISGWDKTRPEPPEAVTLDRLECITFAENCRRNSLYRYPKAIQDIIKTKGALTRAINRKQGKKRSDKGRRKQREHDLGSADASVRDD